MSSASHSAQRPAKEEYGGHFATYIELVPEGYVADTLSASLKSTAEFLSDLPEEKAEFRYASGKWSLKEAIGHISDTERIMSYRLLRIARGDATPLPGFDQDAYMENSPFAGQSLAELIEDYISVRKATLSLLRGLPEDAWTKRGTVSGVGMSVKALAYVIAGHELHHLRIVKEKYLG
ncbi:DinB family protein [Paenibacillaceae bacterium WGS1546]|uniref:DinB family protein n=1 Tax=Cohnella sp. WGS1546 TaxID=3366810 RepID=UPI00372CFE96